MNIIILPCTVDENGSGFVRGAINFVDVSIKKVVKKSSKCSERLIVSEACIARGLNWLGQTEPKFQDAAKLAGPIPLRLRDDGFSRLFGAIVSQQLSVASAGAIWCRLEEADMITIEGIENAKDNELRGCGLSRQKIRYARALCAANLDYAALRNASTEEVVKALVKISGIGVWTAEIYAMFSLGRADVFASGDLALQEAVKILFELEERPTEKQLRIMAEKWSPWRAVAARLLWSYHKQVKSREGIR